MKNNEKLMYEYAARLEQIIDEDTTVHAKRFDKMAAKQELKLNLDILYKKFGSS
jgi:hypothetical protein